MAVLDKKVSPIVNLEGSRAYMHVRAVCDLVREVLIGAKLDGVWALEMVAKVKSRGPTKFKLKTGCANKLLVILKPGDQDSAASFNLRLPPGVQSMEAYTQIRSYLEASGGTDSGDLLLDSTTSLPPVLCAPPLPESLPLLPSATELTVPLKQTAMSTPPAPTPNVLSQLVQLQQQVEHWRFAREAATDLRKSIADLTDRRILLELELKQVQAEIAKTEQELAELPTVDDQTFQEATVRWKTVEQALSLLQSAFPTGK